MIRPESLSHFFMKEPAMRRLETLHFAHSRISLRRIARALLQMLQVRQSRHRLKDLEPHMLCDIGLTQGQALQEANRPLWDAPEIWRQRD